MITAIVEKALLDYFQKNIEVVELNSNVNKLNRGLNV